MRKISDYASQAKGTWYVRKLVIKVQTTFFILLFAIAQVMGAQTNSPSLKNSPEQKSVESEQQQKSVSGKVTDTTGSPLPGVTIQIKGTKQGTITDANGKYSFSNAPANATLLFSFVGMKNQEIPTAGKLEINTVLEDESEALGEVVVTGYGNFKKASFTGSANTVDAAKLKDVPAISLEQKLQGQSSGVFITSSSGQPGSLPSIRIRGLGSFSASNDPLYIIDGVPVSTGAMNSLGAGYMTDSKTSIMSTINPDDIENITVIKDAAAASLYGSRAANGVILITTKRGKAGKSVLNFKLSGGISDLAVENRPMLSGDDRRSLILESLVNYATDQKMSDPTSYANSKIDTYAAKPWSGYTDWSNLLLRKHAYTQDYEASLSGGDDKGNYLASVEYLDQDGMAINSDLKRYSSHLTFDKKISDKLQFNGSMILSQVSQNLNEERTSSLSPFFLLAGYITPSDYNLNKDGTYNDNMQGGTSFNPYRDMKLDMSNVQITRILGNGATTYEITKGLKAKESLSYDYTIEKDKQYFNPQSAAGQHGTLGVAQSIKSFTQYARLFSSTSLGYIRKFKDVHNVDVLVAYEIEDFKTDNLSGSKQGIASDHLTDLDAASTLLSASSSPTEYRLLSYISRLNYDYKGKYYLGGSFRRDGTSRLSSGQRWGNFWSVSGMWRLSDEAFLSGIKSVISDLKLRTSYGVNGNLPNSFYAYQGLYSYTRSYQGALGSYESTLTNTNLKWEKNYNLNLGLDFTLYSRVSVTAEYYSRQTKDLLFNIPLSYTSGFTARTGNIGRISNQGVELEINSTNVKSKDFQWTTNLSISHNTNKVKKITDQLTSTTVAMRSPVNYIPTVGGPYYEFQLKEFAGVDPATGSALYYLNTKNTDGTLNKTTTSDVASAQAVDVGKQALPKITSNLTNSLYYKAFDLNFTFVGSWGGYNYDFLGGYFEVDGAQPTRNYPAYVKNRWQKPGDITNTPRYVFGQNANNVPRNTTRYLHSADYVRLKSLSFGYTLPDNLAKKAFMSHVRLYVSGSNLWTNAAWDNYDPEQPMGGFVFASTPITKTLSFGADINF